MIVAIGFLIYAVIELVLFIWLGSSFSWLAAIGLLIAFFVLGILVMSSAGISAVSTIKDLRGGEVPAQSAPKIGNATVTFLAGLVIALPGYLSSLIGLIALIPFVRTSTKTALAKYARYRAHRSGLTVVTVAYDGFKRSRFYQGDVVSGEIIVEEGIVSETGLVLSESAVIVQEVENPPNPTPPNPSPPQ